MIYEDAYTATPIYIYSKDGEYKIDLTKARLLGDVSKDLNLTRQGDKTQLWMSKNGAYFTGSCLDHLLDSSNLAKIASCYCPVLITKDEAKAWVVKYYGGSSLPKFGFDDALEI